MKDYQGPSAMVAFVRAGKEFGEATIKISAEGPILWASGEFLKELEEGGGGWDIGDHEVPDPPGAGLFILEGFIEVGVGEDPDVNFEGQWRRLSHWEILLMRYGNPIWHASAEEA